MSTAIEINGVSLISGKEAAQKAGYSADYIARLAREQKITGTQIERQWFIEVQSLQKFLESNKIEKEARKRQLQEERLQERTLRENVKTHEAKIKQAIQTDTQHRGEAVIGAGIVALVAVMVTTSAVGVYLSLVGNDLSVVQNLAQSSSATLNKAPLTPDFISDSLRPSLIEPSFVETSSALGTSTTFGEGVLLLSPGTGTATIEKMEAMFSDPIDVALTDGLTGRVTIEEEGKEISYPVVVVPNSN